MQLSIRSAVAWGVPRYRKFLRAAPLLLLPWLAGCSAVDILNGLSPRGGVTITHDLAYAPGPRHALDVYRPIAARDAPTLVFFYGGSWQEGDKSIYAFLALALARRGIVVMIPDYRVYPEGRFADYMADGAAAVAWARAHASDYGGDPRRLVLMGHSAGAQIAALLTLDGRWLGRVGLDPHKDIAAMVGLAGPYDFLPLKDATLKLIFGPPALLADTQPIGFVDGRNPPMFLGTDDGDDVVLPKNTINLARKIEAAGGPVAMKSYRGLSHRLLIGAVSEPLGFLSTVREDVTRFVLAAQPRPKEAER